MLPHTQRDLFAWIDELSAHSPLDYIKRIIHIIYINVLEVRCCWWFFYSLSNFNDIISSYIAVCTTHTHKFYRINESILQCIGTHTHTNKQCTKSFFLFFKILPTHHHLFIIVFFPLVLNEWKKNICTSSFQLTGFNFQNIKMPAQKRELSPWYAIWWSVNSRQHCQFRFFLAIKKYIIYVLVQCGCYYSKFMQKFHPRTKIHINIMYMWWK